MSRPTPSVSSCSALLPTDASGSRTPGATGASSPTVALVSAKNTIDTNVSTSGTRLSSVIRNFANCAARRWARASRPRAAMLCSRRGRAARTGAQRDAGEARQLEPLEHVHDVVVAHVVVRDHGDIAVLRVLLADLGHE